MFVIVQQGINRRHVTMLPSTSDTFRYGASCFYTPLLEGGKIQVLVFIFWVDPYITIISAVLLKHLTLRKCGFNGLNSFCLFCLLFFGFYTLSLLPYRKTAVKSLILAPYAKHVTRGNREKRRLKIEQMCPGVEILPSIYSTLI